jgi:hypothetical protein
VYPMDMLIVMCSLRFHGTSWTFDKSVYPQIPCDLGSQITSWTFDKSVSSSTPMQS